MVPGSGEERLTLTKKTINIDLSETKFPIKKSVDAGVLDVIERTTVKLNWADHNTLTSNNSRMQRILEGYQNRGLPLTSWSECFKTHRTEPDVSNYR